MQTNLAQRDYLPAMSDVAIDKVCQLEALEAQKEQIDIETLHTIHGGVYSRTILIPARTRLTGALIKIATLLIVSGHTFVFIGDEIKELNGYNVLAASGHRKQVFLTRTDTYLTMMFATKAKSVAEAEEEFTDDAARLLSRKADAKNTIIITGE